MSFKALLEPVIENGIKNTNYFEGRLLSSKDLTEQEAANKHHRQQLGQILGHGVVEGLEVSIENAGVGAADPLVRINKGMAITLEGEIIELPIDYIDIQLSRTLESVDPNLTGFKDCTKLPSETLVPSGAGLYILVMSPANAYKEYAPKSGLQKKGIAQNCGRAYVVEGVQFRLVKFDPTLMPDISDATRLLLSGDLLSASNPVDLSNLEGLSMMRNLVAHICFGTEAAIEKAKAPNINSKNTSGFGLDALLGLDEGLSNCDTPLALIYWNLNGLEFIDNWAVKRKASHRDILPYGIPSFTRNSYARAEENRLQFQEHLAFLEKKVSNLDKFNVIDYFRYIPAIGYLPVNNAGNTKDFSENGFFKHLSVRGSVFIEAARLVSVTRVAMAFWPIDLESGEFIWLYRTRENAQESDKKISGQMQEYIIFTSGHTTYAGNARFDLAKWDYSNFGFI
jgi:hypothetical protein